MQRKYERLSIIEAQKPRPTAAMKQSSAGDSYSISQLEIPQASSSFLKMTLLLPLFLLTFATAGRQAQIGGRRGQLRRAVGVVHG